ncbi:MAG: 50S ribosomal protein L22 [Bacteroidetes bacterium]|jgi:large subunit ribosomal protein L22|nr:50S ribosomal protein L22 [Bacteroidota bacterium]
MEAVAKLKNVPMSARKMRLVVDLIRNKDVEEALDILRFTKKEAASWLEKALLSAIANWEDKLGGMESADDYDLYIKTIFSDDGSMLKRFRPAPHGRAHRIRKRTNHVTIIVENRIPLPDDEEIEDSDAVEVEEMEDETAVEE